MARRATISATSLLATVLASACAKPPTLPPAPPIPPPPAHIFYEEPLAPPQTLEVEIIGLRETLSEDRQQVTVTGTLINRGTRPTSEVAVTVSALDANGQTVTRVEGIPSSARIRADGGSASFAATLDNLPDVRSYHVEVVAR